MPHARDRLTVTGAAGGKPGKYRPRHSAAGHNQMEGSSSRGLFSSGTAPALYEQERYAGAVHSRPALGDGGRGICGGGGPAVEPEESRSLPVGAFLLHRPGELRPLLVAGTQKCPELPLILKPVDGLYLRLGGGGFLEQVERAVTVGLCLLTPGGQAHHRPRRPSA